MKGPYGFELNESSQTHKLQGNSFFCDLLPAALKDFDALKFDLAFPQDAIIFMEKQAPRGVYVLCEGQAKLWVSSSEGKTLILRIAKPGEVLGLMSALSGNPYELTAETLQPCHVAHLPGDALQRFLVQHPEAYKGVASQLGSNYYTACEQLKTVGLSTSVSEKLAKFLLDSSAREKQTRNGRHISFSFTHREIGEFIGTTREAVSRTLTYFKNQHFIEIHGSDLTIQNRMGLENLVSV